MIYKKGSVQDPSNFRPIAPTLVVAKWFHKTPAIRLENFITNNPIFDKSVQKGFLEGINGCVKHHFSIQSMLLKLVTTLYHLLEFHRIEKFLCFSGTFLHQGHPSAHPFFHQSPHHTAATYTPRFFSRVHKY